MTLVVGGGEEAAAAKQIVRSGGVVGFPSTHPPNGPSPALVIVYFVNE